MRINPETDALIIVDAQNDFLSSGTMPVPDAEAIVPRLGIVPRLFKFSNVFFLAHHHFIGDKRSENIEISHCGAHQNIAFVDKGGNASPSPYSARSYGAEFVECLKRFRATQEEMGLPRLYRKLSCPLFGTTFSVVHVVSGLEQKLIQGGVSRVFFAGLNFEYCIRNEIAYLLCRPEWCREIVVLKDLVKPRIPEIMDKITEEMEANGVRFINSMEFMK